MNGHFVRFSQVTTSEAGGYAKILRLGGPERPYEDGRSDRSHCRTSSRWFRIPGDAQPDETCAAGSLGIGLLPEVGAGPMAAYPDANTWSDRVAVWSSSSYGGTRRIA